MNYFDPCDEDTIPSTTPYTFPGADEEDNLPEETTSDDQHVPEDE